MTTKEAQEKCNAMHAAGILTCCKCGESEVVTEEMAERWCKGESIHQCDAQKAAICPRCNYMLVAGGIVCTHCGYVPPKEEPDGNEAG